MSKPLRFVIWIAVALAIAFSAGLLAYLRYSEVLYDSAYDASRFVSAEIARRGETGVFTFTRRIYLPPAEGVIPFLAAGGSKSLVDRNYIATYDIRSGETMILHVEDNLRGPWMPGSGNFVISHTYGDRVVVRQGGQLRSDGKLEYHDYWLELHTGKLTRLPLRAELAAEGYKPEYFYLLDEEGTLVVVSEPLDAGTGGVPSRRLWVRRPDGTLQDVGAFKHYYGVAEGEVHYWSAHDGYTAYSLESGKRRSPSRSEYADLSTDPKSDLNLEVDFAVYNNEGHRLHVGRRINGSWEYEPLGLTVQDLAPLP